ncbi:cob(I)alamin adenosyltransferase [Chryseobacterium defluvii]|uniref:Cob(I)alamin adenosyltransferase n=1 Tax=Chryseobacterium defluvii TaxID=160396 RepID=A0A840KCE9_9FLAO|nr:hypothetical protein [Chryseobacterium defluvii]MBB4807071.1 cob(I)alamin adenosyltransferase [Chryseobacterium defluvii]
MQPENFPYKSLHDYLDIIFKDITPTEIDIIKAKKTYWRNYNTLLKKNQRIKHKEVTIPLTKEQLELLSRKIENNYSVSQYVKSVILQHINNESASLSKKQDLTGIEQQLFLVTDYLESLLYQRRFVDNTQIGKLEQHILYLQQLLETQF